MGEQLSERSLMLQVKLSRVSRGGLKNCKISTFEHIKCSVVVTLNSTSAALSRIYLNASSLLAPPDTINPPIISYFPYDVLCFCGRKESLRPILAIPVFNVCTAIKHDMIAKFRPVFPENIHLYLLHLTKYTQAWFSEPQTQLSSSI